MAPGCESAVTAPSTAPYQGQYMEKATALFAHLQSATGVWPDHRF
jgi:hypothetical protein